MNSESLGDIMMGPDDVDRHMKDLLMGWGTSWEKVCRIGQKGGAGERITKRSSYS